MTVNTKHYKSLLEKESKLVTEELGAVGRVNPSNPSDWQAVPDKLDIDTSEENSIADGIESYEENNAILQQLEIRLNEIKAALVAIENNSYGVCVMCSEPIEKERLDANPAALTCKKHVNGK